jgi:hypothetical protein
LFRYAVGWPVQGILPKYSMGTDVLTCDRSHTRTVIASGDEHGRAVHVHVECSCPIP